MARLFASKIGPLDISGNWLACISSRIKWPGYPVRDNWKENVTSRSRRSRIIGPGNDSEGTLRKCSRKCSQIPWQERFWASKLWRWTRFLAVGRSEVSMTGMPGMKSGRH